MALINFFILGDKLYLKRDSDEEQIYSYMPMQDIYVSILQDMENVQRKTENAGL
jgi:hypothetical protein